MNTALFVVGIVVLLLGIGAYVYGVSETQSYLFGAYDDTKVTHPYRGFGWPLALIGLIALITGAAMPGEYMVRRD